MWNELSAENLLDEFYEKEQDPIPLFRSENLNNINATRNSGSGTPSPNPLTNSNAQVNRNMENVPRSEVTSFRVAFEIGPKTGTTGSQCGNAVTSNITQQGNLNNSRMDDSDFGDFGGGEGDDSDGSERALSNSKQNYFDEGEAVIENVGEDDPVDTQYLNNDDEEDSSSVEVEAEWSSFVKRGIGKNFV